MVDSVLDFSKDFVSFWGKNDTIDETSHTMPSLYNTVRYYAQISHLNNN